MLKIFFDISTGFRFSKISVECSVHLCSCPWLITSITISRWKGKLRPWLDQMKQEDCQPAIPRNSQNEWNLKWQAHPSLILCGFFADFSRIFCRFSQDFARILNGFCTDFPAFSRISLRFLPDSPIDLDNTLSGFGVDFARIFLICLRFLPHLLYRFCADFVRISQISPRFVLEFLTAFARILGGW